MAAPWLDQSVNGRSIPHVPTCVGVGVRPNYVHPSRSSPQSSPSEERMSQWMWYVAAAATGVLVYSIISMLVRVPMTRAAVLEEVRRMLRGGVVEQTPGRGPQA